MNQPFNTMVTVPTDSMGSAGQPAPVYAVCFAGHIQVLYILDTDHFRAETGVNTKVGS